MLQETKEVALPTLIYIALEIFFKIAQDMIADTVKELAKKFPVFTRLFFIAVAIVLYSLFDNYSYKSKTDTAPSTPIQPSPSIPVPKPEPVIPPQRPTPIPTPTPQPVPRPAPKPRVALTLDSALAPYRKDLETILSTLPLRNGTSIDIAMSMQTPETPDMPGAEPATISVIVDATATFKSSNGSPLKTMLLPQYKVTQIQKNIPNTDTYIRDRVKSAARGFAKSILEGL